MTAHQRSQKTLATFLPSLSSCLSRMYSGERRFARRLESFLEDDYLCWYDVPIGPKNQHPDFVILNPRRGLLVLEIKDWKLETIRSINRSSVELLTDRGIKHVANPLEQARQYSHAINQLLERDVALVHPPGHPQRGKLALPYGYGAVLTNISRKAFDETDLSLAINPSLVICQDEMLEATDAEEFQERLWGMFCVRFQHVLTMPQLDRIRWHLFPEIRIQSTQSSLIPEIGEDRKDIISHDTLLQVMDLQQEQLARSLGNGHRVIHGVAGSGKTLILGYRCLHLARTSARPILVLCYNSALAAKLTQMIGERGLTERVTVSTFHSWCSNQLRTYHVPSPEGGDAYFERLVNAVIGGVDRGQIPRAQYGALLIDEGHDLEPEWLKLVVQMIDPDDSSLLLLYDDAQSIYDQRRRRFSFASVGIQARGRTTILRLNYRNTSEVLATAYEFAKEVLTPHDADEDDVPLVLPESAGRHGPLPVVERHNTLRVEAGRIAEFLREQAAGGCSWNEMAVLYRTRFIAEEITAALQSAGVPFEWLQAAKGGPRFRPGEPSVKVITMHSSKGLEFPVVAIPGLGYMPHVESDPKAEARLLYVAITRAMDHLLMTYHRASEFALRLDAARMTVERRAGLGSRGNHLAAAT